SGGLCFGMLGSVGRVWCPDPSGPNGASGVKKTSTRLADGRELIYYDLSDATVRDAVDRRPLDATVTTSEIRRDSLLCDRVAIASHRQARTYHPPPDQRPLRPADADRPTRTP